MMGKGMVDVMSMAAMSNWQLAADRLWDLAKSKKALVWEGTPCVAESGATGGLRRLHPGLANRLDSHSRFLPATAVAGRQARHCQNEEAVAGRQSCSAI
eukprot:scaffold117807_cov42-Cyclotella_meneghiniana.AAC.1